MPQLGGEHDPFGRRGQERSLGHTTFYFVYSFAVDFFFSARSVLAGPGNSEVTETGPCVDNDKVECGDFIARS